MPTKRQPSREPTIDPELERQLDASAGAPVAATFTLRTPAGERHLDAEQTQRTVQRLIAAASKDSSVEPVHLRVFPNIQSFALSGPARLVRWLLRRREIASAMANEQAEDMLIRPVKRDRHRHR